MKHFLFFTVTLLCANFLSAQNSFLNPADSFVLKGLGRNMAGYPKEAQENGIEGTVYIAFDIDSTCTIVNARVLKGIGYGCDEMALETIRKFGNQSLKINLENCPRMDVRIPVYFELQ